MFELKPKPMSVKVQRRLDIMNYVPHARSHFHLPEYCLTIQYKRKSSVHQSHVHEHFLNCSFSYGAGTGF